MDSALHFAVRAIKVIEGIEVDTDNINITSTDPAYIGRARRFCKGTWQKPLGEGGCPMEWATIQYRPSMAGNVIYLLCFFALFGGQLWYGIRNKTWGYMGAVATGIFGEIIGYIGRIMLNLNPFIMNNFLVNLICLTISPALLTAGIYLCLSRVIVAKGSENSRLKPKLYTYIFVGFDLLALILQAIGGGMAATGKDAKSSQKGTNVMIGGLISQVISMVFFFIIWGDYVLRVRRARLSGSLARTQPPLYEGLRGTRKFKLFQWSLFVATVLIFVRCVYRVAELWEGFSGHLANDEATFMVFEGPMIILAVTAMTIFHPGRVFGSLWVPAGNGIRSVKSVDGSSENIALNNQEEAWKQGRTDTSYSRV